MHSQVHPLAAHQQGEPNDRARPTPRILQREGSRRPLTEKPLPNQPGHPGIAPASTQSHMCQGESHVTSSKDSTTPSGHHYSAQPGMNSGTPVMQAVQTHSVGSDTPSYDALPPAPQEGSGQLAPELPASSAPLTPLSKRLFLALSHKPTLSRTWAKRSYIEEQRSAPLVGSPHARDDDINLDPRASPRSRPMSFYASPADIAAFRSLPVVHDHMALTQSAPTSPLAHDIV
ncbi:hypothetical protein IAU60_001842 [Kwoniella sp. DSM 27419]